MITFTTPAAILIFIIVFILGIFLGTWLIWFKVFK